MSFPPTAASHDYKEGPYAVDVPAGQSTVMIQVPIFDDKHCECVEDFTASLEVPDAASSLGVVPGANDTAVISIINDECELILLTHYEHINDINDHHAGSPVL